MTQSMRRAIDETNRRRAIQVAYNVEHNITPQSIIKPIDMSLIAIAEADYVTVPVEPEGPVEELSTEDRERLLRELEAQMREYAKKFEFEKAAQVRDRLKAIKAKSIYEEAAASGTGVRRSG
jgi:excinuclease ABC subunit B